MSELRLADACRMYTSLLKGSPSRTAPAATPTSWRKPLKLHLHQVSTLPDTGFLRTAKRSNSMTQGCVTTPLEETELVTERSRFSKSNNPPPPCLNHGNKGFCEVRTAKKPPRSKNSITRSPSAQQDSQRRLRNAGDPHTNMRKRQTALVAPFINLPRRSVRSRTSSKRATPRLRRPRERKERRKKTPNVVSPTCETSWCHARNSGKQKENLRFATPQAKLANVSS